MKLLQELVKIHAPSGNESAMTKFLLDYIEKHKTNWKVQPEILQGGAFQDCIMLKFGKPTTAVFAHIDSIGYTVKYDRELVKVGGPKIEDGDMLCGSDSKGPFEAELVVLENDLGDTKIEYLLDREIDRGTDLSFVPNWREDEEFVQCCYMDNRLGVWNALQLAETLENGVICFSTYEEHGGGTVGYLAKYMFENWGVRQALISDITWVTEGVQHGKGVALSMRDSGIPRRTWINKIIAFAQESKIPYQLEVESAGGSDGNQLQKSPYPFDWMFIGAPEDFVHTPNEKVHKKDIAAMEEMYKYLMARL